MPEKTNHAVAMSKEKRKKKSEEEITEENKSGKETVKIRLRFLIKSEEELEEKVTVKKKN